MKRIFDIIVASIALILLLPIMIVVGILVKKDGGNILFRQKRVGINGKHFFIYKYRSMVMNAQKLGGYCTKDNDARITPIGKIIRRTSLDELPQLLNVIKGEMSLVGPRPNVPEQKAEYTSEQWDYRNSVLPGITGLAQATVRSEGSWQERYDLDCEYIEKHSLKYDCWIIYLTVIQIIKKGGN